MKHALWTLQVCVVALTIFSCGPTQDEIDERELYNQAFRIEMEQGMEEAKSYYKEVILRFPNSKSARLSQQKINDHEGITNEIRIGNEKYNNNTPENWAKLLLDCFRQEDVKRFMSYQISFEDFAFIKGIDYEKDSVGREEFRTEYTSWYVRERNEMEYSFRGIINTGKDLGINWGNIEFRDFGIKSVTHPSDIDDLMIYFFSGSQGYLLTIDDCEYVKGKGWYMISGIKSFKPYTLKEPKYNLD